MGNVTEDDPMRIATIEAAFANPEQARAIQKSLEASVCSGFYGSPHEMLQAYRTATQQIRSPEKCLFEFPEHQRFVAWITEYIASGEYVDAHGIIAAATDAQKLEYFGGLKQLTSYAAHFFSAETSKKSLGRLVDRYGRHAFSQIAADAVESAAKGQKLSQVVFDMIQKTKPLITVETKLYTPEKDLIEDTMKQLTNPDQNNYYIESYFAETASNYGHQQRGQIIMVGAPTGNGKTAFAFEEIDFSLDKDRTVDAFVMESTFRQYLSRRISRRRAIPIYKFNKKGALKEAELEACREEADIVASMKDRLFFSRNESYSALEIDAMIQERKQKTGRPCDLIVVDHLNTMKPMRPGSSSSDYNHWVETTQELQDIASRENAALLLCAQLTTEAVRSSFTNSSKLPTIGAFRGGAPTEKAKVCLILHKSDQDMLGNCPVVEQRIVIVKANDGNCGTIDSLFLGPFTKHIEDVAPISHVTGRRMDLGNYRKLRYGHLLEKLGFDCHQPRGAEND